HDLGNAESGELGVSGVCVLLGMCQKVCAREAGGGKGLMIPGKWISAAQAEAQMKFNRWNELKNVVILDTETTGLYDAEIVEIAVIDLGGNILMNTLVRPKNPIPAEVTAIHGINNEMVA